MQIKIEEGQYKLSEKFNTTLYYCLPMIGSIKYVLDRSNQLHYYHSIKKDVRHQIFILKDI